jgi:aminopeptidase N
MIAPLRMFWGTGGRCLLILWLILPSVGYAVQGPVELPVDCRLEVFFDVPSSLVKGILSIPVRKGQELTFDTAGLRLVHIRLGGEEVSVPQDSGRLRILPPREGTLDIDYEGTFQDSRSEFEIAHPSSVIGPRGIFLTGAWYPVPDAMCRYRLRAILPPGYDAVSEGETVEKTAAGEKTAFEFDFPHPLESISLIATDRFKVMKDHFGDVEILAYLFPEDLHLGKNYIEEAKHYLGLYQRLISPFPYRRFSIVENFLPTGYSMPTYTLIGESVIRLPFIAATSLGHEILHQWFGNLVYVDDERGNWAEGLTAFLSDHLYEAEKGRGPEYRKSVLINYQSYVHQENEFPLKDFRARTDRASQAIGYGKALMVFQMLKDMVGEERFYESIRDFEANMRFKKASWDDLKEAFERVAVKDLRAFFSQWIDKKGLPDLVLDDVKVLPSGDRFQVAFTLTQGSEIYSLDLPVTITSSQGKTVGRVSLRKDKERFEIVSEGLPMRIAIDEEYVIARKLSPEEFPPVIARLVGEPGPLLVLPPSGPGIYGPIVAAFTRKGVGTEKPDGVSFHDLESRSLIILGTDNPVSRRLYGDLRIRSGFNVVMKRNPWNLSKVAAIFSADSREDIDAAFQKIFHYGTYSALSFEKGLNVYKATEESAQGITEGLYQEPAAVNLSTLSTLTDVIDRVSEKPIVYIGETHDRFSDHVMQLEIIRGLQRKGKKIAIGMEMFQRRFQGVVDAYIEGRIDEKAFLKGTEYFKAWGYDYYLYRPILLFARAERIPVGALNLKQDIVDKVFKGGLDSLTDEERAAVPARMDFSDEAYRKRLVRVYREHKDFGSEKFDFFYQAQVLWDETMSEAVDRFLKAHPGRQMIVLAGTGHLAHAAGIPRRTARRNGLDYAVVLNDTDVEKGIADFVLSPGEIQGLSSPRLMVLLRDEAGVVEITSFTPHSVSEEAGMKVGDRILAMDGAPVETIDDLKVELFFHRQGDKVKVRVSRKEAPATREMDFDVTLR